MPSKCMPKVGLPAIYYNILQGTMLVKKINMPCCFLLSFSLFFSSSS